MTEHEEAITMAEYLIAAILAEQMRKRLLADGFSVEEVLADLGPDNAEELLTELVEGDEVLDDGSVHKFYRNLLDDHRAWKRRMYEAAQELERKEGEAPQNE
jgi:hypothetical protein